MNPLTVTQFVEAANAALTALAGVVVEGEVDEFRIIHNKWVTFQLKDAESSVGCFMPIWQFKTQIEDGMLVRVTGKPALRNKGFFSFVATAIAPAGEGSLKRAFELLFKKLTQEGLFDPARKRPLPRFPEHIALITSRDAAAYSDFIKVLQARQGGLQIYFLHTQVQGDPAPQQIISALEYANTHLPTLDVIALVRGGGSLEDLQAFNDETVVRAVAASRTPTIVGVGHERDTTLAELAADVRASTPSNAAEILVRSRDELLAIINRMSTFRQRFTETVGVYRQRVEQRRRQLTQILRQDIDRRRQAVETMTRLLRSLSPAAVLSRGFSITRTQNGAILKSSSQVSPGDTLETQLAEGTIHSQIK